MKIIKESEVHSATNHVRQFCFRGNRGAGFSFPCDASGEVCADGMHPAGLENYRKCLSGEHDVQDLGIQSWETTWRSPAIGKCDCGRQVELDGFTCPCDCGRDYNASGQLLAPRECWGEETGEHYADIARY